MANEKTQQDDRLGSLWKRESSKGTKYMTGVINLKSLGLDKDVQVVCFANSKKEKDTQPDVYMYLSKPKDSAPASKAKSVAKAPAPEPEPEAEEDSGIL